MLRNYFATAIRNLLQHRLHSAINIGGLALGLAACLLILLFVRDELSYDRWLPDADRIAKLEITFKVPGREPLAFSSTPGPAKAALEKDFASDIERAVRLFQAEQPMRAGDRQFADDVTYVDPEFFKVFDLPVVSGEREAVLERADRLLVSERMAAKYFGEASPIGRTITIDNKLDFTVVGVLRDLPSNTHLDIEMIALFDTKRWADSPSVAEEWTSANVHTYVMFRSPEAIAQVESELPAFTDRNVSLKLPGFEKGQVSNLLAFNFMPVPDIHLYATKAGYVKPGGDIAAVIAFSAIAGLILLIACINFVNLATARSMKRAREVSMRKVLGATRGHLIVQHLGEAVLTAMIALVLAIALVELALRPYNAFLDKELSLDLLGDPFLLAVAAGLVLFVGVLGGLYPAIYLSRFRPAHVLKANQSGAGGSPRFRNVLVVFQFAISIALIVCTGVVYGQTVYARSIELGFDSSHKLVVDDLTDVPASEVIEPLGKEIAALPGVRGVAFSSDTPPLQNTNMSILYRSPVPDDNQLIIERLTVDHDFFALYGVKPLAGRVFSKQFPTDVRSVPADTSREATEAIVVNQTFLSKLGVARPQDAIGVTIWDLLDPTATTVRLVRATIIGVVPDMHMRSVRMEIPPLIYYVRPDAAVEYADLNLFPLDNLTIAVEPGRLREVHDAVTGVWQRMIPSTPLRTEFVDEDLAAQYDADEQRAQTLAAFAVFAVLIACLGLFGLASFAAERRTKEIGLRKVMGASVRDIVRLLVWQFSKPVLVANLIAWPVAFYFMNRWLSGFRYAIDLTSPLVLLGLFGGAGLVALAIAWSTVAGHATRVARSSPIHALRCE
jgi:putative ABC transport system permease protein